MKIAVASPPYPHTLNEGLAHVERLIKDAAAKKAEIICFPESYLPGYPIDEFKRESCTQAQLEAALNKVRELASKNAIAVIIPMDWHLDGALLNVAHVIAKSGELLGHQTKNQLDPSEDSIWQAGAQRRIFEVNGLKFGISICHEGFRYPETVRWAVRQGAKLVFHPNYTGSDQSGKTPKEWGARESPYYEKAQMLRAMENTIYFAPSNYAFRYPESASAVIAPDGSCLAYQEYGKAGVAIADIDLAEATGLLGGRFKPQSY